jgi:hypothetical protein
MPTQRVAATQTVLLRLLNEHHLSGDTRLYREAERASLVATATPGVHRLPASAHACETLVDVYGPGYPIQAEEVGAGLAFAESATSGWQETKELRAAIHFITADVAIVDGEARLERQSSGDASPFTVVHRFTDVLVKQDGRWSIAQVRGYVFMQPG